MAKKPRSDSKLKNLPQEEQEALWELRTTPQVPLDVEEPEGAMRPFTQRELQVEIPLRHGFTVSAGSLSEWESWFQLKQDFAHSVRRAEEAKLQYLAANPDATPEALMAVGQMIFTNKSMQEGDVAAFVKLSTLMERRKAREFDEKKFQSSLKSKLEAGLDALFEEIKGNAKAEHIFAELKDTLVKS